MRLPSSGTTHQGPAGGAPIIANLIWRFLDCCCRCCMNGWPQQQNKTTQSRPPQQVVVESTAKEYSHVSISTLPAQPLARLDRSSAFALKPAVRIPKQTNRRRNATRGGVGGPVTRQAGRQRGRTSRRHSHSHSRSHAVPHRARVAAPLQREEEAGFDDDDDAGAGCVRGGDTDEDRRSCCHSCEVRSPPWVPLFSLPLFSHPCRRRTHG